VVATPTTGQCIVTIAGPISVEGSPATSQQLATAVGCAPRKMLRTLADFNMLLVQPLVDSKASRPTALADGWSLTRAHQRFVASGPMEP